MQLSEQELQEEGSAWTRTLSQKSTGRGSVVGDEVKEVTGE